MRRRGLPLWGTDVVHSETQLALDPRPVLNDSSLPSPSPSSLQSLRACSLIRPPFFLKGISTFLPRGLLCCCLCLLTFVLSKWALYCILRHCFSISLLSAIADPIQSLSISAGPLPKNDLTSLTPKAKLILIFTKNYITRNNWIVGDPLRIRCKNPLQKPRFSEEQRKQN